MENTIYYSLSELCSLFCTFERNQDKYSEELIDDIIFLFNNKDDNNNKIKKLLKNNYECKFKSSFEKERFILWKALYYNNIYEDLLFENRYVETLKKAVKKYNSSDAVYLLARYFNEEGIFSEFKKYSCLGWIKYKNIPCLFILKGFNLDNFINLIEDIDDVYENECKNNPVLCETSNLYDDVVLTKENVFDKNNWCMYCVIKIHNVLFRKLKKDTFDIEKYIDVNSFNNMFDLEETSYTLLFDKYSYFLIENLDKYENDIIRENHCLENLGTYSIYRLLKGVISITCELYYNDRRIDKIKEIKKILNKKYTVCHLLIDMYLFSLENINLFDKTATNLLKETNFRDYEIIALVIQKTRELEKVKILSQIISQMLYNRKYGITKEKEACNLNLELIANFLIGKIPNKEMFDLLLQFSSYYYKDKDDDYILEESLLNKTITFPYEFNEENSPFIDKNNIEEYRKSFNYDYTDLNHIFKENSRMMEGFRGKKIYKASLVVYFVDHIDILDKELVETMRYLLFKEQSMYVSCKYNFIKNEDENINEEQIIEDDNKFHELVSKIGISLDQNGYNDILSKKFNNKYDNEFKIYCLTKLYLLRKISAEDMTRTISLQIFKENGKGSSFKNKLLDIFFKIIVKCASDNIELISKFFAVEKYNKENVCNIPIMVYNLEEENKNDIYSCYFNKIKNIMDEYEIDECNNEHIPMLVGRLLCELIFKFQEIIPVAYYSDYYEENDRLFKEYYEKAELSDEEYESFDYYYDYKKEPETYNYLILKNTILKSYSNLDHILILRAIGSFFQGDIIKITKYLENKETFTEKVKCSLCSRMTNRLINLKCNNKICSKCYHIADKCPYKCKEKNLDNKLLKLIKKSISVDFEELFYN